MSAPDLLPCPLCGGEPVKIPCAVAYPDWWQCTIVHDGNDGHYVRAIGNGDTEQEAIEAAVAAWNRRAFEYTWDDVGSAFINGYTAACEQPHNASGETLEKVMKRYGWVRERTCRVVRYDAGAGVIWLTCSECGNIMPEHDNYCSNCGARVMEE